MAPFGSTTGAFSFDAPARSEGFGSSEAPTFGARSNAAASSGAFTFGASANSQGFGSSAVPVFGGTAPAFGGGRSRVSWRDDASEPFGRVESTQQCFARNGETSSASKWTPPSPPSRPLFQRTEPPSTSLFGPSKPLFSAPQQTTSLFVGNGSSVPAFGYGQPTVSGGVFPFGATTKAATTSSTVFGSGAATFGGSVNTKPTSSSSNGGIKSAFAFGTGTVFGSGSSSNTAKPPLAPSAKNPFAASTSNPFAKSTTQFGGSTSNPFAPKTASVSTSSPFTPTPNSGGNPFAARVAPSSTVNPFAVPSPTPAPFATTSKPKKNSFAVPASAWSTGWSTQSPWKAGAGSAATKFKSGLRPAFKPIASSWNTGAQQQQSQPGWDWVESERKLTAGTAGNSFKTPSVHATAAESVSEATSSSSSVAPTTLTSSPSDTLVASPDENPYGSGSFGAGLLEQKVKTAVSNPPSSVELKLLDTLRAPVSAMPPQPSARFASRLGLARQPLQALLVRSVQPRFPSHHQPTAASSTRAKLPQADPFRFSSSFSRLAISKRALRIRVEPSAMSVSTATDKTESEDDEAEAKAPELSDTEADGADESEEQDNNGTASSPACPTLLNDEYFTEPSVSELQKLSDEELSRVENFSIGRRGCGKISFLGATDVRGLQLDELVSFSEGAIVVYPDEDAKPDVGSGLNKPAVVDLHGISSEENESHDDFVKRLQSHTNDLGATFLGYDGGVWSFRVEHF